jgi:hypothetical protein
LLGASLGGLLGALLAVAIGGLAWSPPVTLLAGLLLGAGTGLGLQLTAVVPAAGDEMAATDRPAGSAGAERPLAGG